MRDSIASPIIVGLIALLILFVIKITRVNSELNDELSAKNKNAPTLFTGISGNYDIKVVNYEMNEGDKVTKESVLKNVQWAKVDLWPTIGASKPTLFYMDDNYHIHSKVVDEARIVQ